MDDIRPPKRPIPSVPPRTVSPDIRPLKQPNARRQGSVNLDHRITAPAAEPLLEARASSDRLEVPVQVSGTLQSPVNEPKPPRRLSWKKWLLIGISAALLLTIIGAILGYMWYQKELTAVSNDKTSTLVNVTIESGSTPSDISTLLKGKQLIRSKNAFDIYTRVNGLQAQLQAGSYRLSPAESTPEIVKHLVSGNVDEFSITFFPGATLTDTTDKAENKKVDVTTILKRAGYSEDEIKAALNKTYDHPVFATKPASADLEGYVYAETYNFASSATVEDILTRTFDELYTQVKDQKLEEGFKAQGLTLYEGITLASIVQREVGSADDQKQVAAVFYNRLKSDMALGSDVTYHYAADKLGVARDYNLDSPYNTRKNSGLTPGPISAPGASALLATAYPAQNNYLYFLSGDDDVTYFGTTVAEHEANIRDHCAYKCSLP
jgi:UPF0755 protein